MWVACMTRLNMETNLLLPAKVFPVHKVLYLIKYEIELICGMIRYNIYLVQIYLDSPLKNHKIQNITVLTKCLMELLIYI